METRARYLLIGVFALIAIGLGFGFVYWLNSSGGLADRASYRVRFDGPVSGLFIGSQVLFNGLRVGEVTDLALDPSQPHQVIAIISVDARTPVRADTTAGLDFRGLTGVATVSLTGGSPAAAGVATDSDGMPFLIAPAAGSQDVMGAARQALQRFDQILSDNAEPLKNAIADIEVFADALARNSPKLDQIAEGLAKMVGGDGDAVDPGSYLLTAPTEFPAIAAIPENQLLVADPEAVILFDTQRVLLKSADGATRPGYPEVKWSDNLPVLLQNTVVKTFENAGYSKASRPADGLITQNNLALDIRDFTVSEGENPTATVEIGAKVLSEGGDILGTQVFKATVPLAANQGDAAAAALNSAFAKVTTDLVVWVLGLI